MDKKIYILRHGETKFNNLQMMQGRSMDIELNEEGWKQAQRFYDWYKDTDFDVVITSDLIRSQQTVRDFIEKNNIPHAIDKRVTEISWGVNEGKKIDAKVQNDYNVMLEEWTKGNIDHSIEEGESGRELMGRIDSFIDYLKNLDAKKVLICTHGMATRMLIVRLLNLPLSIFSKLCQFYLVLHIENS